jgi:BlaI family transcriptional regulator, penicillinase repressor
VIDAIGLRRCHLPFVGNFVTLSSTFVDDLVIVVIDWPGSTRQMFDWLVPDNWIAAMSPRERKDLSNAEWKVMRIAWKLQKAMSREIYTIAGEKHGWSPATVKTLLRRLVDKGYLTTTPVGNGFVYRPVPSAFSVLHAAADALLNNAIEGTTGPLLAHMVERTPLDAADLDVLQKLIDAKKKSLSKRPPRKRRGAEE